MTQIHSTVHGKTRSERLTYTAQKLSEAKRAFGLYRDMTAIAVVTYWQSAYDKAYQDYTNPFGVEKTFS